MFMSPIGETRSYALRLMIFVFWSLAKPFIASVLRLLAGRPLFCLNWPSPICFFETGQVLIYILVILLAFISYCRSTMIMALRRLWFTYALSWLHCDCMTIHGGPKK